ncbi:dihydrodipicolinate synthase family protein [Natrarchaeobius chitinivorans]|uniref:Dihydrodipicolinate synthase family protein n=1 Tax=Natrarchaeobius chitinivorans TaxID=1679083 RepID=A0A3N6M7E6_NATCH|nr:dihydrodipicolinate synthase family protein [Natrarchaeobius chitinivorans]RQG96564.1 dihydrodipicolinate synthase family protein [Natrarchaeobius chitinivorans]
MDLSRALEGMTTPLVTPFDPESDEIDEAALEDVVDHLLENGIDGLFPCGTTGEFASLTPDERTRVTELVVKHADGEVPVLAGAAATTVPETLTAIEDAADVGADAAAIVPPYFHTANAPAGNRQFFESVADESPLPLVLYNIPTCTGLRIEPETLESIATRENVIGIKDSSGDLEYFRTAVRRTPEEFLVLQGYDALLVPALRMGGDGGVNALSHAAPTLFGELLEAADEERGLILQDAVSTLFEPCNEYGFAPVTKAALVHRGVIPSDSVRPPLVSVPADGREAIETATDDLLETASRSDHA